MAGSVLNSTVVLRLNFCAKMIIFASIFATAPSCKTLALTLKNRQDGQQTERQMPTLRKIKRGVLPTH
jgi:hypothetical protein